MNDDTRQETRRRIRSALNAIKGPTVAELLPPGWQSGTASGFFRASLGGVRCPRALYFRAEGDVAAQASSGYVQRAIGHALEHPNASEGRSVAIIRNDLVVVGAYDVAIGGFDSPETIAKFFCVSGADWARVQERELEEHRGEMNLLAVEEDAKFWSICYVHEPDGQMVEHLAASSEVAAKWAIERLQDVAEYRLQRIPPRCPYESQDRGDSPCECRWSRVAA